MTAGRPLSLEATLRTIAEAARHIIGAHLCLASIVERMEGTPAIRAVSFSEKYAPWRERGAQQEDPGIAESLCREPKPVRVTPGEMEGHPRWRAIAEAAGGAPPLRGLLGAPLLGAGGRAMGCIWLSDKDGGDFTAEDEGILVHLARIAVLAVEHAQRQREAEEACRVKDEVLGDLVHDLRTPLNAILGWIQVALAKKADEATITSAFQTIERNARHLAERLKGL